MKIVNSWKKEHQKGHSIESDIMIVVSVVPWVTEANETQPSEASMGEAPQSWKDRRENYLHCKLVQTLEEIV
jgi:hypothetical protein